MGRRRRLQVLLLLAATGAPATRALADERDVCASAAEAAQNRRSEGKLLEARRQLLVCARDVCPGLVKTDCTTWLGEVEASIPTVSVHARDDRGRDLVDVLVVIDGTTMPRAPAGTALRIDPGPHRVRYEASGFSGIEQTVVVAEGERNRLLEVVLTPSAARSEPEPRPVEAPRRAPIVPLAVGGVGVVALAAFAVLEIDAQVEYRAIQDGCGAASTCAPDDVDALRTKFIAAGAGMAAGVVLIGVGAVLLLTRPPAAARAARRRPALEVRF